MLSLVLGGCALLLLWLWMKRDNRLSAIPGPKGIPLLGVSLSLKPSNKIHLILGEWAKQYGPIIHIPLPSTPTIFVSGYEAIYDVMVKRGKLFGGRPQTFRLAHVSGKTGIIASPTPDATWLSLRKTSQRHLKQFGDGLSRLESVITEVGDEMFEDFTNHSNKPYDPKPVLFDITLKSIAFLITGERRSGDALTNKIRVVEKGLLELLSPLAPLNYLIIDYIPWLRYLGLEIWREIKKYITLEKDIWDCVKAINAANPDSESLCKTLMAACDDINFSEKDARKTSISLLLAGVTTTSTTMYAGLNILAHHPDIQDSILDEIHRTCPSGIPTLPDRPKMPYTKAFLFELLRYTTLVSLCVPHEALEDTTLGGYQIPKGTTLLLNLWGLHHDPEFWVDPDKFRPDRFLDASGELHPADHPVRKHLMPFGAGTRVCLGESLALARLFLWITKTVNLFRLTPAEDTDPATAECRNYQYDFIIRSLPFEVIFTPRQDTNYMK